MKPMTDQTGKVIYQSLSDRFLRDLFHKYSSAVDPYASTGNTPTIQTVPSMANAMPFPGPKTVGTSSVTEDPGIQSQGFKSQQTLPAPTSTAKPAVAQPTTKGETITYKPQRSEKIITPATMTGGSSARKPGVNTGEGLLRPASLNLDFILKLADAREAAVPGNPVMQRPVKTVEPKEDRVFYADSNTRNPEPSIANDYGEKPYEPNYKTAGAGWLGKIATVAYSRPSVGPLEKTPKKEQQAPIAVTKWNRRMLNVYEQRRDPMLASTPVKPRKNKHGSIENHGEPMPKYSAIDIEFMKLAFQRCLQ